LYIILLSLIQQLCSIHYLNRLKKNDNFIATFNHKSCFLFVLVRCTTIKPDRSVLLTPVKRDLSWRGIDNFVERQFHSIFNIFCGRAFCFYARVMHFASLKIFENPRKFFWTTLSKWEFIRSQKIHLLKTTTCIDLDGARTGAIKVRSPSEKTKWNGVERHPLTGDHLLAAGQLLRLRFRSPHSLHTFP